MRSTHRSPLRCSIRAIVGFSSTAAMSDRTAHVKPARQRVAEGLERIGLAGPTYRFFEWTRSLEALPETLRKGERTGTDGLPLPPPALRVKVTHTARAGEFIRQGE